MDRRSTSFLVLVGAACVVAAGLGAYLAVRSSNAPAAAAGAVPVTAAPQPAFETMPLTPAGTAQASGDLAGTPAARAVETGAATAAPAPGRAAPAARPAARADGAERRDNPRAREEAVAPPSIPATDGPYVAVAPDAATVGLGPIPEAPRRFEDVTIGEASVIGIQIDTAVSSRTAEVEDPVSAVVTRDVSVDGRTVIPAGSRLEGNVTMVSPGGRFRERAQLAVRFTSLVLDGERIPIETETITREGDAPGGEATSRIGAGAVVGAILGSVIGGKKGAAIGGAAGAAGGTAVVMAGDPDDAALPSGSRLTVRLLAPVTITLPIDAGR